MGFSGFFSTVGASVFSAHCFSESDGWRPFSNRSVMGDSATTFPLDLRFSDIEAPQSDGLYMLVDVGQGSKKRMCKARSGLVITVPAEGRASWRFARSAYST